MNRLAPSVPDISRGDCVPVISGEVGEVPGVSAADVDLATKTLTVAGAADPAAVRSAIAESGYQAA